MRIIIAVLCLTVLCLSVAVSAPAGSGGVLAPAGRGGVVAAGRVPVLAIPDLIVKQVEVSRGGGEFPMYTFKITVANIGTREARLSNTAIVFYAWPRTDQPMVAGVLGEVATPAIAAGAQTVVTITHSVGVSKMYLFVTADFPTTASLLGSVRERKEGNNVLVVPLDTRASFPRTFR